MTYQINGKPYTQRPLVLGQSRQLLDLLSGVRITDLSAAGLIESVGDKLPEVLAVVLIPEGCQRIKDRDLAAIAADVEEAGLSVVLDVVTDFFGCNQLSLLLGRLGNLIEQLTAATGSNALYASSPMETSPNGTPSPGA